MIFTQYASSSKGNLYTVEGENTRLIIEAGLSIKEIRRLFFKDGKKLTDFDACLITHEHQDHARAGVKLAQSGVPLYCSRGTAEYLNLEANILQPKQSVKIGEFTVWAFDVSHDAVEPFGFLIASKTDKLLFVTDTHYLKYKFSGLTIIAIECNYSHDLIKTQEPSLTKRLSKTHMSLDTVLKMLKANDLSKVREIHLLHLSDDNSDQNLFISEVQKLTGIPVIVKG